MVSDIMTEITIKLNTDNWTINDDALILLKAYIYKYTNCIIDETKDAIITAEGTPFRMDKETGSINRVRNNVHDIKYEALKKVIEYHSLFDIGFSNPESKK